MKKVVEKKKKVVEIGSMKVRLLKERLFWAGLLDALSPWITWMLWKE